RRLPSGLNATHPTPLCPRRVRSSRPLTASQTFTSPFQVSPSLYSLAVARRLPSGLNTTLQRPPLWLRSAGPLTASQTFTVPSWLALARRLPSGLNATLRTQPVCPRKVVWLLLKRV